MKIACIQMDVVDDKKVNISKAEGFIDEAEKKGAEIVVLPEMFVCPYENKSFVEYAEEKGGYIYSHMKEISAKNNVVLVAGSMPEKDGDRIYNTSFVFDKNGDEIARHRKMHLFDINVENGQTFKESDTFSAGDDFTIFECEYGTFGVMICFDIRFVELARILSLKGARAIFVPGAFNMTTGPAHWEMSFRQRALDNQIFMVGCAPARDEKGPYVSYGNSIVTNPWGEVVAKLEEKESILYSDIDLEMTDKIREQLPILKGRRTDLYSVVENL